jgi:hypothetical protein
VVAGLGFEPTIQSPSLLSQNHVDPQIDPQDIRLPADLQAVIDAWPTMSIRLPKYDSAWLAVADGQIPGFYLQSHGGEVPDDAIINFVN